MRTSLRSKKIEKYSSLKSDNLGNNSLFGKYYSKQDYFLNDIYDNILINSTELTDSISDNGIYILPGENTQITGSSNIIIGTNGVNNKTIIANNIITIGNDILNNKDHLIENDNIINIPGSAGTQSPGENSINIGFNSGSENSGSNNISIGYESGQFNNSSNCINLGYNSGLFGPPGSGFDSVASENVINMGYRCGQFRQGKNSISIGYLSGNIKQKEYSIGIGMYAGACNQSEYSIAIGNDTHTEDGGTYSIAIGNKAGEFGQGSECISIGNVDILHSSQKNKSILIGKSGAKRNQGDNSTIIGNYSIEENGKPKISSNSFFFGSSNISNLASAAPIGTPGYAPYATPNSVFVFNSSGEIFQASADRTDGGLFIKNCIQSRVVDGATSASNNVLYYDFNNYEIYKHLS